MARCGQALTSAMGPSTYHPASPQQLVPVISTNWDWTPWWPDHSWCCSCMAASPNQPHQPTRALEAPHEQQGNLQPLFSCKSKEDLTPSTQILLPFSPPCFLQKMKLKTSPRVPRWARCARCHSQVQLTSALTKLNENELGRILIFQSLDEKDSFKAFKRFSPLHSSFQRSVLCSLNRRHVLKLLPSFIKLVSDLQMQLPLIESCNIYLPSCDIWNCAHYMYWGKRGVMGKAWGDGGRKPLLL